MKILYCEICDKKVGKARDDMNIVSSRCSKHSTNTMIIRELIKEIQQIKEILKVEKYK